MFITSYINSKQQNCCIIFTTQQVNLDIDTPIKDYLSENINPEIAYIIFNSEISNVEKSVFDRFNSSTVKVFITYSLNGDFQFEKTVDAIKEKVIIEQIKEQVLKGIFLKHDSILKASSESYFVVASRKFATHFVRIANLFKNSNEISIISILLLPYINNNIDYIYCDTPTIFSLIYSSLLYKLKENKDYKIPEIRFYSSSDLKSEDFDKTKNSIYIISTSINGTLPTRIVEFGIDWSNVIVLFSFDEIKKPRYKYLFKDKRNELIDQSFYSLPKEEFEKKYPHKIFPIKFEDQQFIPTQPMVSKFLLAKEDAPDFVNLFHSNYGKYNIISCFNDINAIGNKRDLFFDITKLLDGDNYFTNKLHKQVINKLPSTKLIFIYIDNENSKALSDYIIRKSKRNIINKSISEFENDKTLDENGKYNFYVISSCISNGKKVSKCSMLLRKFKDANINFISGFVRCNDKIILRNIKANLTYGEYSFSTYSFYAIEEIYLPNEDSSSLSWEGEKKLIEEVLNDQYSQLNIDRSLPLIKYLKKRINVLNGKGLINELYLPSIKLKSFELNKNFAFFKDTEWLPKDINQSQVYFTILSVLHNYRLIKGVKQTLYERYILDPENFIRFNDSIIRATFLRCCTKEELNYDLDFKASEKMLNIILGLVNDLSKGDNIIYEFLLAICLNRVNLDVIHLKVLHSKLISSEYSSDYILKFYLQYINEKIISC